MNNMLLYYNKNMEIVYEKYDWYMSHITDQYNFYMGTITESYKFEAVGNSFVSKIATAVKNLRDAIVEFFRRLITSIQNVFLSAQAKRMLAKLEKSCKKDMKNARKKYDVPDIDGINKRVDKFENDLKRNKKICLAEIQRVLKSGGSKDDVMNILSKYDQISTDMTNECWRDITGGNSESKSEKIKKNIKKGLIITVVGAAAVAAITLGIKKLNQSAKNSQATVEKILDPNNIAKDAEAIANENITKHYRSGKGKMTDAEIEQAYDEAVKFSMKTNTSMAKMHQRKSSLIFNKLKQTFSHIKGDLPKANWEDEENRKKDVMKNKSEVIDRLKKANDNVDKYDHDKAEKIREEKYKKAMDAINKIRKENPKKYKEMLKSGKIQQMVNDVDRTYGKHGFYARDKE